MRARVAIAAFVGMGTALLGHALDRAGALPFVHEAADVRTAMGPLAVLAWLGLAAGLSALAAATRPVVVGAPCAVVVAGLPELIGRHDLGAVFEPGALAGALVQWLLLAAVAALLVVAERELCRRITPPRLSVAVEAVPFVVRLGGAGRRASRRHRSRAPPSCRRRPLSSTSRKDIHGNTVARPRLRGRSRGAVAAHPRRV